MTQNTDKYFYHESVHNLVDPKTIIPVIMEIINPKSVVDIGCGIGTFLKVFKDHGVNKILGVDGEWVDKELLKKNIPIENFKQLDLTKAFILENKYDLAVCLEVAEHLPENSAATFVAALVTCSDQILFSAAFPGQGGQNHLNEQWPDYWQKKFEMHDYHFHNVLRPIFWNNKNVSIWYKQNMYLVVKKGKEGYINKFHKYFDPTASNHIHPDFYYGKIRRENELLNTNQELHSKLEDLTKGRLSSIIYLKMIAKFFLRKIGIYNK